MNETEASAAAADQKQRVQHQLRTWETREVSCWKGGRTRARRRARGHVGAGAFWTPVRDRGQTNSCLRGSGHGGGVLKGACEPGRWRRRSAKEEKKTDLGG